MKIKKELIKRTVAGETVLVPVGRTVYEANGLFMLNELGDFVWELLPKVDTPEQICEAVLAEYEVAPEQAAADVAAFLEQLRQLDII